MSPNPQFTTPPSRIKRSRRNVGLWLSLALFVILSGASAQTPEPSAEYNVKAVFLFNFTQFTEWPEQSFPSTNSPIVIGIAGTDPFGNALDEVLRGEMVNRHPLVIRRLRPGEAASGCHVVFISRSERDRLPTWLEGIKGTSVLTVSDLDEFCQNGGMIRLYLQDKKMKFEINREVAEGSGIKISSRMLKLARVVKTEG